MVVEQIELRCRHRLTAAAGISDNSDDGVYDALVDMVNLSYESNILAMVALYLEPQ